MFVRGEKQRLFESLWLICPHGELLLSTNLSKFVGLTIVDHLSIVSIVVTARLGVFFSPASVPGVFT